MVIVSPLVLDQPAPVGTSPETTLDTPVTPTYPAHCLIAAATFTHNNGPAAGVTAPAHDPSGDADEHSRD